MTQMKELIKRNLRLYFRDRGMVFFSLLTMLIVIVLMLFFLGDMSVRGIEDACEPFARDAAKLHDNALRYVMLWTVAGILAINSVTVPLSVTSIMVRDAAEHRLRAFSVSPVPRLSLAFGYIGATWLCSVAIGMLTLLLSEIFMLTQGFAPLSAGAHFAVLGLVMINSLVYSSMMYFLARLVGSQGAWSGLGTVISTVVGFLGAIYVPMGSLPAGVQSVLKCTPVLWGTAMLRSVVTEQAAEQLFDGMPAELAQAVTRELGTAIEIGGSEISLAAEVTAMLACGIIMSVLAVAAAKRKPASDR